MGLFRDACRAVAADFPDVACDDEHVDAMAALLVRRGADFDVLVTENMLGDILSDLTGELAGSLGMAGSVNAGATVAMAQAAHGAAPDIAGQGIANPVGMIASVALLLRWLGERRGDAALAAIGDRIERAVATMLAAGTVRTPEPGRPRHDPRTAAIAAAARTAAPPVSRTREVLTSSSCQSCR